MSMISLAIKNDALVARRKFSEIKRKRKFVHVATSGLCEHGARVTGLKTTTLMFLVRRGYEILMVCKLLDISPL